MSRPTTERPPLTEPLCNDFRARIIEAEPINDRFITDRAKQSRSRIARLRVPSDCPKLAKPEAEGCPRRHRFSFFIHARSQSNWIWKPQAKHGDWQFWRAEKRFQRIAGQFITTGPSQSAHGAPVNVLRVLSEKNWADQPAIPPTHE